MKNFHPAAEYLRPLLTPAKPEPKRARNVFDAADDDTPAAPGADYANANLRVQAAAIAQEFAATPDDALADDETLADRLMALVVGAVDADKDGELSDEEAQVAGIVLEALYDYLASKGVSDEDCDALLNNWDADAAARVRDLLADGSGDDEASDADIDGFAFGDDAESAVFDDTGALMFDAAYKKKTVIKHGKKVRINKRISGHVRLSAKQKIAVRKMQRKSHSAVATIRRMKSLRVRKASGL
jgi:hypothetical protein